MSGPWEQYASTPSGDDGPWQQFVAPAAPTGPKPKPIGKAAQDDFLRAELRNADWFTRNLAGAGTALSDLWERGKQLVGQGDQDAIHANRVMAEEAPVGAALGQAGVAALPFGLAGNSVKAAAGVGAGLGFARPVDGEQTFENIAKGTAKNTLIDAALGGAGQAVANAGGKYIANKLQDLALRRSQNAVKTQTLNDALDAGLTAVPSEVKPTLGNTILESIGGKAATGQSVSNKNAPVFDSLARKALGLTDDVPLEPAILQARRDLAYQVGYKPVADLPVVPKDGELLRELAKASPLPRGSGAVANPGADEAQKVLAQVAARPEWTGAQLMDDIRLLREQARANYGAAERSGGDIAAERLAQAQKSAANALENLAARNLNPQAVELMREARRYIAKTHTVEDSLIEGSGSVDPRALARMIQRGDPLSDELAVAGRFANVYKGSAKPPAQVASPGVSKLDAVLSAVGAGTGGMLAGPVGVAAGAAAPFIIPRVARALSQSGRAQNSLRDIYRLGLPLRTTNALLPYLAGGSAVLGGDALAKKLPL